MGVEIEADLAAVEARPALLVAKYAIALRAQRVGPAGGEQPAGEDVVVDAVGKGIDAEAHMLRHVAHAGIELPAGFGRQAGLADFVANRAFVDAVRAQLGNVGGPEAAREVALHGQLLREVVGRAQAAAVVAEGAAEARKLGVGRGVGAGALIAVEQQPVGRHPAHVIAQAPAEVERADGLFGHAKHARFVQLVSRNQEFDAQVAVLLVQAAAAQGQVPAVALGQKVAQRVVHGAQLEVERRFGRVAHVAVLAPQVLLVAGLKREPRPVLAQHKIIVDAQPQVVDLLLGHGQAVAAQVGVAHGHAPGRVAAGHILGEPTSGIACALRQPHPLVERAECEVRIAPALIQAHEAVGIPLVEARIVHPAVVAVLVVAGHLAGAARQPVHAVQVAGVLPRVALLAIVGLVAGRAQARNVAFGHRVGSHEVDDARHGIGAVQQRARPFDNLGPVHAKLVNLNAVLVAPLLAFLLGPVVQGDDAVVAQPAHHRLADGRAGRNLAHAGRVGNGIHQVRGRSLVEPGPVDHGSGHR